MAHLNLSEVPATVMLPSGITLVTGAGQGIGQELAVGLASRGHATAIADTNSAGLETTASRIREIHGSSPPMFILDLTNEHAVEDMFRELGDDSRGFSGLVNNAGGTFNLRGQAIDETTTESWDRLIGANLKTVFFVTRAAVRLMKTNGSGSVVNMSSESGRLISRTGLQAYTAAKSAVIGLTRQLAHELGPRAIRVNAIAPGLILSSPEKAAYYGLQLATIVESESEVAQDIPLRRFGRPADLVGITHFLLSAESSYITGQTILVNGGHSFG